MFKPTTSRNADLRVGPRRPGPPPDWLRIYQPPDDEPPATPAIPDRSVWRSVLATWPIPDRQRWGELANAYEDQGDAWNEAEWKAFNACNDAS